MVDSTYSLVVTESLDRDAVRSFLKPVEHTLDVVLLNAARRPLRVIQVGELVELLDQTDTPFVEGLEVETVFRGYPDLASTISIAQLDDDLYIAARDHSFGIIRGVPTNDVVLSALESALDIPGRDDPPSAVWLECVPGGEREFLDLTMINQPCHNGGIWVRP